MPLLNRRAVVALAPAAALAAAMPLPAAAATGPEIERDARTALKSLRANDRAAEALHGTAKGILIFPKILKAGLIVGGEYGQGVLLKGERAQGFYRLFEGSVGLQIGAQEFGYALFFMNDNALGYLDRSDGWSVGVGPTVVAIDQGAAASFSTTTAKDDIYAFYFDQKGLMAGISLNGSKIQKFTPEA